ncbi:nucleoside 2-deoxyribosyltransferase [Ectobacillus ponti]|uniref:Nucleoside 2-deoxyribosyltransferase n=1 Tax=Ectobacillus ponti TaxID=2961894 RepID=A0AA42BRN2_9BACI|nr:nucleoside 2-deoxyribosyltransferase [Ectobacillus ponti]MCP8967543.1 nucleoside 2-deoxyribosyltransferase [Ectobacillus ponti]
MNFYLASGLQNKAAVREAAAAFAAEGFMQTYDWTKNERPIDISELQAIGEAELQAVAAADFVAVLLPGGKGTHAELGMALALGKRVYLYSASPEINDPAQACSFYHIAGVDRYVGEIAAFIEYVLEAERGHARPRQG